MYVWLWLVGRAVVTSVASPGSVALSLGRRAPSSATLPLRAPQLSWAGDKEALLRGFDQEPGKSLK